jgi:REP element-mobilizing transposase RayT
MQRGNNQQATFFVEEDHRNYLDWLLDAAKKYDCRIYTYVLMTNRVHLLASAERPYDLSRMMQHLGRRFVRYVNHAYRRSGTLCEGRFKASLVDTETYFLFCAAAATSSATSCARKWSSNPVSIAGQATGFMLMASRIRCSRLTSNTSGSVATQSSGNTPTGNFFEASWTRANSRRFAPP